MVAQIYTLLTLDRLLLFDLSSNSLNLLSEQITTFWPRVYVALNILLDDLTLSEVRASEVFE